MPDLRRDSVPLHLRRGCGRTPGAPALAFGRAGEPAGGTLELSLRDVNVPAMRRVATHGYVRNRVKLLSSSFQTDRKQLYIMPSLLQMRNRGRAAVLSDCAVDATAVVGNLYACVLWACIRSSLQRKTAADFGRNPGVKWLSFTAK
jgi:hypothetical protein